MNTLIELQDGANYKANSQAPDRMPDSRYNALLFLLILGVVYANYPGSAHV
jgi:hypothetical protein